MNSCSNLVSLLKCHESRGDTAEIRRPNRSQSHAVKHFPNPSTRIGVRRAKGTNVYAGKTFLISPFTLFGPRGSQGKLGTRGWTKSSIFRHKTSCAGRCDAAEYESMNRKEKLNFRFPADSASTAPYCMRVLDDSESGADEFGCKIERGSSKKRQGYGVD